MAEIITLKNSERDLDPHESLLLKILSESSKPSHRRRDNLPYERAVLISGNIKFESSRSRNSFLEGQNLSAVRRALTVNASGPSVVACHMSDGPKDETYSLYLNKLMASLAVQGTDGKLMSESMANLPSAATLVFNNITQTIQKLESDLQPTFEEPEIPSPTRKSQMNNVKRQISFKPPREVEDTSILIKCVGDGSNGMPSQHSSSFIFCSNEAPATDFRLVYEAGRY